MFTEWHYIDIKYIHVYIFLENSYHFYSLVYYVMSSTFNCPLNVFVNEV